jgi:hypothetical protein
MSHWLEDGWLYCVLEAPTTTAVCDHHKMHGLACDTVREMEGLHGCRAMSPDNRERVRAAIQHFWHAVPA